MNAPARRKLITAIALGAVVGSGAGAGLLTLTPTSEVDQVAVRASGRAATATSIVPVTVATTVVPTPDTTPLDTVPTVDPAPVPVGDVTAAGASSTASGSIGGSTNAATTRSGSASAGTARTTGAASGSAGASVVGSGVAANPTSANQSNNGSTGTATNPAAGTTGAGNIPTAPAIPLTPPSAPQAPTAKLGFDTVGTTIQRNKALGIVVNWNPSTSGRVSEYQVTCRPRGATNGGTSVTVAANITTALVSAPTTGTLQTCTVIAKGAGGTSPTATAPESVATVPAPPQRSIGRCLVGSSEGIIGERYIVEGLSTPASHAAVTKASYRMRSSIDQRESELRSVSGSWASLDEFPGHYAQRSGASVTVWIEWTVTSGGTTFTLQGPESSSPCS